MIQFPYSARWFALTAWLCTADGFAAEKVRFGAPGESTIQTRPERSLRESLSVPEEGLNLNSATRTMPGMIRPPAAAASAVRENRADDVDQRNWIFRDTRSVEGIQRAFGVESHQPATAGVADRDSISVIQDYFSRRAADKAARQKPSELPLWGKPGTSRESTTGFETDLDGVGLSTPGNPTVRKADDLFGQGTFRNTLNSDNLSIRRYYRDLYTTPSSVEGTSPNPLRSSSTIGGLAQVNAPKGAPSFTELAEKAALLEALSEPSAKTINRGGATQNPAFDPFRPSAPAPVINNGSLIERRNGRTEFPSRRQ